MERSWAQDVPFPERCWALLFTNLSPGLQDSAGILHWGHCETSAQSEARYQNGNGQDDAGGQG